MKNLLYVLAIVLLVSWILGALVFSLGKFIHVLLLLAIVSVIIRFIKGDKE